ncbi:hypothetical protein K8I28_03800 [bacterium]|nr:hypothetical protein [bacterium]
MFGKRDLLVLILLLGVVSAGVAFRINKGNIKDQTVEDIKFSLQSIHESCLAFETETEEYPSSISALLDGGYLDLDPITLDEWTFTLYPHQMILAESTSDNPIGSGKRIAFDIERDLFLGYDQDSDDKFANQSGKKSPSLFSN